MLAGCTTIQPASPLGDKIQKWILPHTGTGKRHLVLLLFEMVERSRVFAIAGFVFSGLSFVFLIASFASPYWVESQKSVSPSGFVRLGLWEACFSNYRPTIRPIVTKRYEGCWAALSIELRDLYDYFYPPWLRAVQGMITITLVIQFGIVIINILYFIACFRTLAVRFIILAAACAHFLSAFFIAISTIMFGVRADTDRQWLPQPDANFLSWAYGFCILSGILSILGGMCMMTDFFKLRLESNYVKRPPPQYAPQVVQYRR